MNITNMCTVRLNRKPDSNELLGRTIVDSARISTGTMTIGEALSKRDLKLIRFLWDNEHTCYDAETEVLTSEGFVPWPEVTDHHQLAAVEPTSSQFVGFETPRRLVASLYSGKMLSLEGRNLSMCVTPNHKAYCSLSSTQEVRSNPIFELRELDQIMHRPMRMKLAANGTNLKQESNEDWYRFIGFYVGDGWVVCTNKVGFNLKKQRKLVYLRQLLSRLGLKWTERTTSNRSTFLNVSLVGARELLRPYGLSSQEKCLPSESLTLSQANADALLEGLRNSDGSERRTTWVYCTCSLALADSIQALGALCGKPFSKTQNNEGLYVLQAITRSQEPRINESKAPSIEETEYDGYVYCAEVSTGLLVVRRDGKVMLSGNSPFRHAYVSFHIEAPIHVLRQWWKHQIGAAWSEVSILGDWNEASGRYKEFDAKFYSPGTDWRRQTGKQMANEPMGKMSADTEELTHRVFLEHCWQQYQAALERGLCKEQARFYLPNTLFSECYWTVSLQGILWFLHQRLKQDAQKEIRDCAHLILDEMRPYLEAADLLWTFDG